MSKTKEVSKSHKPIIFMNTPIKDEDKDAIGIVSSVEMVKTAIDNNAKMIGVIAEYGSGKSSLTELLSKSKKFTRLVRINMWDALNGDGRNEKEVSVLTKSFVYQLARGISKAKASYVNKILNNNYSIVSFSIGYQKTWWFFALAILFYAIYLIGGNIDIDNFVTVFGEERKIIGMIYSGLTPIAKVAGIVFAALGIYFSSLAFSSGKEANQRQTGINEVFSAYAYLFDVMTVRKKPTLVIVDDLDRIEEKEVILGFLKELYRFNNLCVHKKKQGPVFLVSIAPEVCLKKTQKEGEGNGGTLKEEKVELYDKIFDYIVSLKPVHYDDYQCVVNQIISSEPEKKKLLNELLPEGEKINVFGVSSAFEWIYKGNNLTLREIKERLNRAIALFIDLKNKDYEGNPYISFETCVCVTYLERTYPEEYFSLLKKENEFSEIIQESLYWRNTVTDSFTEEIADQLNNRLGEWEMNKDLAFLILKGVIDTDYRMYFYSFPKGSYIRDIDQKTLCNYLEYPLTHTYKREELRKIIDRLEETKKLSYIQTVLYKIVGDDKIIVLPEVIFGDKRLWETAIGYDSKKTAFSCAHYLTWEKTNYEDCCEMLSVSAEEKSQKGDLFFGELIVQLQQNFALHANDTILKIRKALLTVCSERKSEFLDLFLADCVPLITREEIELINNASDAVLFINNNKFDENSIEYIQELVTGQKIETESIGAALILQNEMVEKYPCEDVIQGTYQFMLANQVIDDELFVFLCNQFGQKVLEYVNTLDASTLTETYLREIDRLCFSEGLKEEVVWRLNKNKHYTFELLRLGSRNVESNINLFSDEEVPAVLEACDTINNLVAERIPSIRAALVRLNNGYPHKAYEKLYKGGYGIISLSELEEIKDFEEGLFLIDASKFTKENVEDYANYICAESRTGSVCFHIFDWLFNSKYTSACTNAEIIQMFMERMNFANVIFDSMSDEEKSAVVAILDKPLGLSSNESAMRFMKMVKCLIPQFEIRVLQAWNMDTYVSFINEANLVSEFAIEKILTYPAKYKLNTAITDKLLELSKYEYAIVGKTLYEEKLSFPIDGVPVEVFVSLFNEKSIIWEYISEDNVLIDIMMKNGMYRDFSGPCTKAMLTPFMRMKQTSDFLEFTCGVLPESDVKSYLKSLNEIAEEKDSIAISQFLTKDENIHLLVDEEIYINVEYRLWDNVNVSPGYKGAFTRKRNAYLKRKHQGR